MNVLHITPKTDGYEVVELLANRHSKKNDLAVIKRNGEIYYTGGFLIEDNPKIREVLDAMPRENQYEFVKSFRITPFVDFYYEK